MRMRAKVKHEASSGFCVDLPSYVMVPGSWLPIVAGKIDKNGPLARDANRALNTPASILALGPTVEVEVPDSDCDCAAGRVDAQKIARRYPAWSKRAAPDV